MKRFFAILLSAVLLLSAGAAQAEDAVRYEAEKAVFSGSNRLITEAAASGFKAVGRFENSADRLDFTVEIPADGVYDLSVCCKGTGSNKINNLLVDGEQQGTFECGAMNYSPCVLKAVPMTAGTHTVSITPSWGWITVDYLEVSPTAMLSADIFDVAPILINPNATEPAKALFRYLCESYGKLTLAGQVCDQGLSGAECRAIYQITGKYPAIIGFDMMDYAASRVAMGGRGQSTDEAIQFHNQGGIVTFAWHWSTAKEYIKPGNDTNGNPRWWGSFYTANTTFDIEKVMNGSDPEGREWLDKDIASIAAELLKLQEAGVPVLWRPLHEASGGWFWWGAKGAEPYKQLWIYLYDQLTNVYGCNNLIWVWNGQHADWYPGDEYVDVIGEDIYAPQRSYAPQHAKFTELTSYPENCTKIVALTENGVVFDIDQAVASGTRWAWFNTWSGDFVVKNGKYSEAYTEASILKKAYDSKYVVTLDELPFLY